MWRRRFATVTSRIVVVVVVMVVTTLIGAVSCQEATDYRQRSDSIVHWTPQDFPHPASESCHSPSARICDPDGILLDHEKQSLSTRIDDIEQSQSVVCRNPADQQTSQDTTKASVEIAVVVVAHMKLPQRHEPHHSQDYWLNAERTAKRFAVQLHDKWGVGKSHCPNGVVLFLALGDRAMYLSRGAKLETILTDGRIDNILRGLKPLLRDEKYGAAVDRALTGINDYLSKGPATAWQRFMEEMLFPLLLLSGVGGMALWGAVKHRAEQREYARVHTQLTQIDRDRAEALQGRYNCTSCPICLEPFRFVDSDGNTVTADGGSVDGPTGGFVRGTEAAGSDGEGTSRMTASRSSLTRQTTTNDNNDGTNDTGANDNDASANTNTNTDTNSRRVKTLGSDGLPIKLLRCGHVFDETCWNEWVSSGSGNIRRCPICQQDVGETVDHTSDAATTTPNNSAVVRRHQAQHDQNPLGDQDRVVRQFNRERTFRLARLGTRYPRYVRPDMIRRWSQPTYDGTLSRDTAFTRSNPAMRHASGNGVRGPGGGAGGGGGGIGYSGFSGGGSSGGRGGTW